MRRREGKAGPRRVRRPRRQRRAGRRDLGRRADAQGDERDRVGGGAHGPQCGGGAAGRLALRRLSVGVARLAVVVLRLHLRGGRLAATRSHCRHHAHASCRASRAGRWLRTTSEVSSSADAAASAPSALSLSGAAASATAAASLSGSGRASSGADRVEAALLASARSAERARAARSGCGGGRVASSQSVALATSSRMIRGSSILTSKAFAAGWRSGSPPRTVSSCQHPTNGVSSSPSLTRSSSWYCLSARSLCQSTNATWQIGERRDELSCARRRSACVLPLCPQCFVCSSRVASKTAVATSSSQPRARICFAAARNEARDGSESHAAAPAALASDPSAPPQRVHAAGGVSATTPRPSLCARALAPI